ncbi:ribonuclease P protein subunit p21 isoform X2 [Schistocerca americana]|uniref:ribonuclease P protein subunit p21 isoform X2 n=1 Tax=Schistocerca americana TaxID=7009 RepID=UPI001F4F3490|nr:ribonuclease P protein subunit p21 isoform X2 [Schistocerca americana]
MNGSVAVLGKKFVKINESQLVFATNKKSMKKFQEEEAFQRMNFLYQAAASLLLKYPNHFDIATHYGAIMRSISKKSVLRMDISLKRSICKGCSIQLIPGVTAKVRIKNRPSPCVLWTCTICNTSKRYHNKKGYLTWTGRPESVAND